MPPRKLGIVMDAIESIKPYKDSSFAMLLEAQRRVRDGAALSDYREAVSRVREQFARRARGKEPAAIRD